MQTLDTYYTVYGDAVQKFFPDANSHRLGRGAAGKPPSNRWRGAYGLAIVHNRIPVSQLSSL